MKKAIKRSRFLASRKTIALCALALVLLIAGGVFALTRGSSDQAPSDSGSVTTADGQKVDLSPPTASDKQSNDTNKQDIVKRDDKLGQDSSGSGASLIITSANTTGVRAYVNGVLEEGGSCSATATQGAQIISAASSGFGNVSYTQCAPLNWPSPLGSGAWSIKVTYKSSATQVTATKDIQV